MLINLHIKQAWWVQPYIQSVVLFCRMTGLEPDFEKVKATIRRGLKLVATEVR